MKFLITGRAGFIGPSITRHLVNVLGHEVVNVDKSTYAGNLESLIDVPDLPNYTFENVENTPYAPSSPYSASKASSDYLVRCWSRIHDFLVVITNCPNNYNPYQFPEKLLNIASTLDNTSYGSYLNMIASSHKIINTRKV